MDKRIIYTVLSILLFLGLAITMVMLRRFVPYTEEPILYDFQFIEITEDLTSAQLESEEVKVLIQFSEEDLDVPTYSLYIYDYETLMNMYSDLLVIETLLLKLNYGNTAGLLITENETNVTLTFNALPQNKRIYKEFEVNVSKNFFYLIPYTGGIEIQLDFYVQISNMLNTFSALEETKDYYRYPVSLQIYTSGSEDSQRIYFTTRGDNYYLRNSFCSYCSIESNYEGFESYNTTSYILS